jgi:hypothetical protein
MHRSAALALILALVSSPGALAGKPKKEKKKDDAKVVIFTDDDREAARVYFVEKHGRGNCPPGLAKKNNGCLPPGQAKKRYVVGKPLPPGLVPLEAPVELTVKLRPCPEGYRYVVLDGDLLKLAVGTMLVVDAVDGLVH